MPPAPKAGALPNCATPRKKWQGHKDSNPGHVVLETTALPAELYPYAIIQNVAEKMGFEPMRPYTNPNGLANRPLQPLEYFSVSAEIWRREWDSNPRCIAASLVFKTSSLNRSDTSPYQFGVKKIGDSSETRTPDTLIKSQVLYRLS